MEHNHKLKSFSSTYLHQRLDYNACTGELRYNPKHIPNDSKRGEHLVKLWNDRYAGQIAGTINNNGYRIVVIDNKPCMAHQIIWKMTYGEDAGSILDHINRDRLDCRINNLRLANWTQNAQNSSINSRNTSGHVGVSWSQKQKRWYVYLGKGKHQSFDHYNDAIIARRELEKQWGEYAPNTGPLPSPSGQLRIVSRLRPNKNGVVGIYYNTKDNRWIAYVSENEKRQYLGCFKTKEEAIAAQINYRTKGALYECE